MPPGSRDDHVIFGKNSDRPREEVQEVAHYPAASHPPGSTLEVKTEQSSTTAASAGAVLLASGVWCIAENDELRNKKIQIIYSTDGCMIIPNILIWQPRPRCETFTQW